MTELTEPQQRAYNILAAADRPLSPKEVAKRLWPNSPGWERVTVKRNGRSGSLGGTMPMKAAQLLWRLDKAGVAEQTNDGRWVRI